MVSKEGGNPFETTLYTTGNNGRGFKEQSGNFLSHVLGGDGTGKEPNVTWLDVIFARRAGARGEAGQESKSYPKYLVYDEGYPEGRWPRGGGGGRHLLFQGWLDFSRGKYKKKRRKALRYFTMMVHSKRKGSQKLKKQQRAVKRIASRGPVIQQISGGPISQVQQTGGESMQVPPVGRVADGKGTMKSPIKAGCALGERGEKCRSPKQWEERRNDHHNLQIKGRSVL